MKILKQRKTFEMTDIYIIIEDLKFKILPRNTNTAKKSNGRFIKHASG